MASVAATDGPSRSLLGGCRCVCSGALLAARSARLRCVSAPGLGATTIHRVPAQPPSVPLEMDPHYLPVLFSLLGTGGANAAHLGEAPSWHGWGCAPQAGPWVPRHRGQPAGFPCCRGMRRGGRGHKKRCPTGLAVQGPMHLACWRAPRLPGRPTLRRTVCRWMTRGPPVLPCLCMSCGVSTLFCGRPPCSRGLPLDWASCPLCGAPLPPWMPCRRWGASVHWPHRYAAQSRWVSWRRPPLQGAVCPCVPARP